MDGQSTTQTNQATFQPCMHIGRLSKKSVQALLTNNYQPVCASCKLPLNPSAKLIEIQLAANLCLHCGYLCCANQPCILQHERDTHIFWAKLAVSQKMPSLIPTQADQKPAESEIICKMCGSLDSQLKTYVNSKGESSEQVKKLIRFRQYIGQNILKEIPQIIVSQFNEHEQLKSETEDLTFGIKNLGNTCFLNSVLQVLFYTAPMSQIYETYGDRSLEIISQEKNKKREILFYYDQIIQKDEAENWHVVSNKKSKLNQKLKRKNLQKFVPEGLVKDTKFNAAFSNFIKNTNASVKQKALTEAQGRFIYNPVQLLEKIGQFDPKYLLKQEQDAQQLLIFLIDILSQGQLVSITGKNPSVKQKIMKAEALLGHQKLSPIQQIFGSYLASRINCLGCNKESWTVDFTYHYPVPIDQTKPPEKSFEGQRKMPIPGLKYYTQLFYPKAGESKCKVLQPMFKPERLTNKQNYYTCQKCCGLAALKQFYIIDPPPVLVISFKRFEHNRKYKITKIVEFQEFINLESVTLRESAESELKEQDMKPLNYELYGVIVHRGETISSGHYVCYVKIRPKESQSGKGIWYEFSDEKVKKVPSKQVFRKEAYILFYQRRE